MFSILLVSVVVRSAARDLCLIRASRQTCQEALLSQNKDRFKKLKNKDGEGDAINQDCMH